MPDAALLRMNVPTYVLLACEERDCFGLVPDLPAPGAAIDGEAIIFTASARNYGLPRLITSWSRMRIHSFVRATRNGEIANIAKPVYIASPPR